MNVECASFRAFTKQLGPLRTFASWGRNLVANHKQAQFLFRDETRSAVPDHTTSWCYLLSSPSSSDYEPSYSESSI